MAETLGISSDRISVDITSNGPGVKVEYTILGDYSEEIGEDGFLDSFNSNMFNINKDLYKLIYTTSNGIKMLK